VPGNGGIEMSGQRITCCPPSADLEEAKVGSSGELGAIEVLMGDCISPPVQGLQTRAASNDP